MQWYWDASPILFSIGPISVRWYGACFAAALWIGLTIMQKIFQAEGKPEAALDKLFLYVVIGIIAGARLAHCLFYEPDYYLSNPIEILKFWQGGLASHGGGVGAAIGVYMGCKKYQLSFVWLLDRIAIPTALFGAFVRTGNFFNSEILGDPTGAEWGVIFANVDNVLRHPAQLYEATAYLASVAVLALLYSRLKHRAGALFGLFLILIFTARITIESVKQGLAEHMADAALSMGQTLSIPFILLGIGFLIFAFKPVASKA